ncbi:MAG TPA: hypothetical protein VHR66_04100 [Gemmataceae bacterium]|jgi:hypothetical protein|nr:hypothetical protein [Gemmataceae bacterium]
MDTADAACFCKQTANGSIQTGRATSLDDCSLQRAILYMLPADATGARTV